MHRCLAFLGVLAFSSAAVAQTDSTRGRVHGVVFDSVTRTPIVRATVQMVLASDPSRAAFTVESNERGEYSIADITPGRYIIGFQHEALDTLALNAPLRLADVVANSNSTIDLAVPSPATIVASVCQSAPADSSGLVIGMLRDARTKAPLDTGYALGRWSELLIERGTFEHFERHVESAITKDGWFALCRVPAMDDLALSAGHGMDSSGVVAVSVPLNGIVRRDVYLGGTLTIRGTVRSEKDLPIKNARVGIIGREPSAVTDSAGAFVLYNAPAGSQTIEARALGYAASISPALLRADADTTFPFRLTSIKRVMDTIHVVATRLYNRDSNGFERRKRVGGGYYFDEAWIRKHRPFDAFNILQQVPSLRLTYARGFQRQVLMRGGYGGYCTPSFFLNGAKMPSDMLPDLDFLASVPEIAGVEVYRGGNTPAQFHDFNNCGSIIVWTQSAKGARR